MDVGVVLMGLGAVVCCALVCAECYYMRHIARRSYYELD
jgi:hypothetical protein